MGKVAFNLELDEELAEIFDRIVMTDNTEPERVFEVMMANFTMESDHTRVTFYELQRLGGLINVAKVICDAHLLPCRACMIKIIMDMLGDDSEG